MLKIDRMSELSVYKKMLHEVCLFKTASSPSRPTRGCSEKSAFRSEWGEVAGLTRHVLLRDWLVSLCCWAASASFPWQQATAGTQGCRSDVPELSSARKESQKFNISQPGRSTERRAKTPKTVNTDIKK